MRSGSGDGETGRQFSYFRSLNQLSALGCWVEPFSGQSTPLPRKNIRWRGPYPEAGVAVSEASRKHGVSANTIYQWRSKFGGMSVSDMQRLRELETENARLKKMYADLALDVSILKEALTKKF